jgi:hypothetical protein
MKTFTGRSAFTSKLPPDTRDKNTPHFMSDLTWLPQWTTHEAIREILANMHDQSVSVQRNLLYSPGTTVEPLCSTVTQNGLQIFDRPTDTILGSIVWTTATCNIAKTRTMSGVRKTRVDSTYETTTQCEMLEIINYSSRISHESLRNGVSSKRGDKSAIGTHGEGLTGACVVLARNGCDMYVDCVANNYTAEIISYKKGVYYQLKHLHDKKINVIQPLPKVDSGMHEVRIRIIFPPNYTINLKQIICSVRLTDDVDGIRTERGTLLTHPDHVGTQYNRHFFVSKNKSCLFGYDFSDPDKSLLKGRDRNVHNPDNVIEECGRIQTDAILSPNTSNDILDKFLRYWCPSVLPNGSKEYTPPNIRYRDLEDGEYLSTDAVQRLRSRAHAHLSSTSSEVPIFCGRITPHLNNVANVLCRNLVESHHVLHNDKEAKGQFEEKLCNTSRPLATESLVSIHMPELCALLKCDHIFGVDLDTADHSPISLWIVPGVYVKTLYVLGDHLLNETTILTESQQVSICDAIRNISDSTLTFVKIYTLLKVFRTTLDVPPVPCSTVPCSTVPCSTVTCSICFEHVSPELEYTTSCNHTFHRNCIAGINQPSCPNCRHDLSNDVDPPFQCQRHEVDDDDSLIEYIITLDRNATGESDRSPNDLDNIGEDLLPIRPRQNGVRVGEMERDASIADASIADASIADASIADASIAQGGLINRIPRLNPIRRRRNRDRLFGDHPQTNVPINNVPTNNVPTNNVPTLSAYQIISAYRDGLIDGLLNYSGCCTVNELQSDVNVNDSFVFSRDLYDFRVHVTPVISRGI